MQYINIPEFKFCRISSFIKKDEEQKVFKSLCEIVKGDVFGDAIIKTAEFSIDFRINDEYNLEKAIEFPDGFLFFSINIEIDFEDNIAEETAINEINKILRFLWDNNYPAVAACSHEDLLIEKGGYNNLNVPWI